MQTHTEAPVVLAEQYLAGMTGRVDVKHALQQRHVQIAISAELRVNLGTQLLKEKNTQRSS